MKAIGSLDHQGEVQLFMTALCYKALGHDGVAIRSLVKELNLLEADFNSPTAQAYLNAGLAIQVKNLASLNRLELATLLEYEIFPKGKAAEDFRSNVLGVFDIVADALAANSVPGFERERHLEVQSLSSPKAKYLKADHL